MPQFRTRFRIAVLVFAVAFACTTTIGLAVIACVASFGGGFALSSRCRWSLPLVTSAAAALCLLVACYAVWCCWVVSDTPNHWLRNFPYPDQVVDWLYGWPLLKSASPFGSEKLLFVFIAAASLSAGLSGGLTATVLNSRVSGHPSLPLHQTHYDYARYAIGCGAGFLLGAYPALLVAKGSTPPWTLTALPLLVASTLLCGIVASRMTQAKGE